MDDQSSESLPCLEEFVYTTIQTTEPLCYTEVVSEEISFAALLQTLHLVPFKKSSRLFYIIQIIIASLHCRITILAV